MYNTYDDDCMMDRIQRDLWSQATGRHRDPQHRAWAVERLVTGGVSKLAQQEAIPSEGSDSESLCCRTCHDRNEMKWTPCGPNSKRNVRTL